MFANIRSKEIRRQLMLALLAAAVIVLALSLFSTHPVAAQSGFDQPAPAINCDVLTECGYIRMHAGQPGAVNVQVFTALTPACSQLVMCDYIIVHTMSSLRVASAANVIPVTGVSAPSSVPACGDLSECGYIQAHSGQEVGAGSQVSGSGALPANCGGLPICDYINAHNQP